VAVGPQIQRPKHLPVENPGLMTPADELQLQQLLQMQFWQRRHSDAPTIGQSLAADAIDSEFLPKHWELTRGITLHSWQQRCVDAWFTEGRRGVIKVVTGAGKTILALAIAERLQQTQVS
jgi:superfamily II DNA or RNA helicase